MPTDDDGVTDIDDAVITDNACDVSVVDISVSPFLGLLFWYFLVFSTYGNMMPAMY